MCSRDMPSIDLLFIQRIVITVVSITSVNDFLA
jgi:hypothetical protein